MALSALRHTTNVEIREPTCRLSHREHAEMIFAAAAQGAGECPTWLILAMERDEARDTNEADSEERGLKC